jgi:hypothetical protein
MSSRLMPTAAGQRWLAEAQSVLFEVRPEQRGQVIRNYLLTTVHVIATAWACELLHRARLTYSHMTTTGNRDANDDACR